MFSVQKRKLAMVGGIGLGMIFLLPAAARAETATVAPMVMKPVVIQFKPGTPAWQRLEKPLLALDEPLAKIAGARQGTLSRRERDYPERTLAWMAEGNKWRMLVRTEEIPQTPGMLKLVFSLGAAKEPGAAAPVFQEVGALTLAVPDTSGSVGSDSQMMQLKLQDAMQKRQQAIQMLSNMLKAMSDTQSGIIQNMK